MGFADVVAVPALRSLKRKGRFVLAALALVASGPPPLSAATPPATVNYQGVLRDQNDTPLTGTYDMTLRLMDAATAGNEILVDQHTGGGGNAVAVANGLFDVALGSGTVSDGSGPGTYTSLDTVFRDFGSVWLAVTVGGETLSPRTPIRSSAYALNATHFDGHPDTYFINTSSALQTIHGQLDVTSGPGQGYGVDVTSIDTGLYTYGTNGPGIFAASGSTVAGQFMGMGGGILVACGPSPCSGVSASGSIGGHFSSIDGTATADIATPMSGITTSGGDYGGYFSTTKDNSTAVYAYGSRVGVLGSGTFYGGDFVGSTGVHGTGQDKGVRGEGFNYGGYFTGTEPSSSYGVYASGGHTGVSATGGVRGGTFTDAAGDSATLAAGGMGISASSATNIGAYFSNGSPYFAYTQIPYHNLGIFAYGADYGGQFNAFSTGNFAQLAYSSYKILGTGVVSFVQNHPADPSKVIVYVAPEGDEAAVYTRGSGRLVNGEARVALGETFALVANPDIGLTATVTPRGEPVPLAVSEVGTNEVVVRGPSGSSAEFDYMVWGLRIGFENQSIVQPKREDSKIPSMHVHEQFFEADPQLRRYTALARFNGAEETLHGRRKTNLARADGLRDAIGVFPYRDPSGLEHDPGRPAIGLQENPVAVSGPPTGANAAAAPMPVATRAPVVKAEVQVAEDVLPPRTTAEIDAARPRRSNIDRFSPEGTIEAGDVVSLTPTAPGSVTRSDGPNDALVIGCAALESIAGGPEGGPLAVTGPIAVATSHVALCRVDASYGAVQVGDRLSPSPVPGVAMRAAPGATGTVFLGRAVDPLPSGSALIRVLLEGR
jgi:hypothetical protein